MSGRPDHTVIEVGSGGPHGAYPVLIGEGLLDALPRLVGELAPAHRYAIVSDAHVAELYGRPALARCRAAGVRADLFTFPRGEASKTREQWSLLTDRLLESGLGRDAAVVALGGGVTGDLAGFVAATYMRGLPVVQAPTSLLAMIDASVGGKTGVDVKAGKNLVGAFHAPRAVIVDPRVLATLEPAERAQGLAEALKHGAVADRRYFDRLAESAVALLAADTGAVTEAVRRSVEVKAEIVGADEREQGRRQVLNFGHTLGHALEAASGYALGHGYAVAAGMVLEARLGEAMGVTEAGTADTLLDTLGRFGLGTLPPGSWETRSVASFLCHDKKARTGRARYVLLERIGSCRSRGGWSHSVPQELVEDVLASALGTR